FRYVSGAFHCAHRVLQAPLPSPFASDVMGRLHALRCVHQRRFTLMSKALETFGVVTRALARERDAYLLKLKTRRSLKTLNSRIRASGDDPDPPRVVHRFDPAKLAVPGITSGTCFNGS